jgi:hypothetical protein
MIPGRTVVDAVWGRATCDFACGLVTVALFVVAPPDRVAAGFAALGFALAPDRALTLLLGRAAALEPC